MIRLALPSDTAPVQAIAAEAMRLNTPFIDAPPAPAVAITARGIAGSDPV